MLKIFFLVSWFIQNLKIKFSVKIFRSNYPVKIFRTNYQTLTFGYYWYYCFDIWSGLGIVVTPGVGLLLPLGSMDLLIVWPCKIDIMIYHFLAFPYSFPPLQNLVAWRYKKEKKGHTKFLLDPVAQKPPCDLLIWLIILLWS